MKKVLVLEDESSIRSFIVINLIRAGYEVVEAETGEEALEKLSENPDVRVTLLDIMLPGIDGFEVCRRVRAAYPHIGIIMLTARSQEMDKVTGLIENIVYFLFGHYQCMSLYQWIDIEKSKKLFVFCHLVAGDFACDDSTEYCCHNFY